MTSTTDDRDAYDDAMTLRLTEREHPTVTVRELGYERRECATCGVVTPCPTVAQARDRAVERGVL